ncbi:hypothetical protein DY000_02047572 [Brassica cretica]|uniref:Uncharacterized protein n=1 Tax=Brassica cretica TaxID=69181 RepID=A0ABQ7EVM3_BRACR|nr:hypothetical protein DY000_02047572 [Brassica cretica]
MYQSISSWAPLDHFAQGCSSGLDPPTMNLRKEGAVAELNQGIDQQPMMKPGKINWVKETSVVGDISQRNGTMTRVVDGKNMRDCSLHLCPSDEEAS